MKSSPSYYTLHDTLMKATRAFFAERDFCEVIPPILNVAIPNEPNIFPFSTIWHQKGIEERLYLPTSPERSLKIALGTGLSNCYAIGHCFRNLEGSGSLHSPEFLMLEWYRVQSSYHDIMKEVQEYITFVSKWFPPSYTLPSESWAIISLQEQFERITGTSYASLLADDKQLLNSAIQRGYEVQDATWRQVFDQILVNEIESRLSREPVFLIDFPSRVSPLCSKKSNAVHVAERFELYMNGVEIANGNTENTDVAEIRKVFEQEEGEGRLPLDIQFLDALQQMRDSGDAFAGVGLGLDRLLMVLTSQDKIQSALEVTPGS